MVLIYATTAKKAVDIIEYKRIPKENREDMAGKGIYLWENIPDARKYSKTGTETFLAIEIYFVKVYNNSSQPFPNSQDYENHETFRGCFQGTRYYMVKKSDKLGDIYFIGGIKPRKKKAYKM